MAIMFIYRYHSHCHERYDRLCCGFIAMIAVFTINAFMNYFCCRRCCCCLLSIDTSVYCICLWSYYNDASFMTIMFLVLIVKMMMVMVVMMVIVASSKSWACPCFPASQIKSLLCRICLGQSVHTKGGQHKQWEPPPQILISWVWLKFNDPICFYCFRLLDPSSPFPSISSTALNPLVQYWIYIYIYSTDFWGPYPGGSIIRGMGFIHGQP